MLPIIGYIIETYGMIKGLLLNLVIASVGIVIITITILLITPQEFKIGWKSRIQAKIIG